MSVDLQESNVRIYPHLPVFDGKPREFIPPKEITTSPDCSYHMPLNGSFVLCRSRGGTSVCKMNFLIKQNTCSSAKTGFSREEERRLGGSHFEIGVRSPYTMTMCEKVVDHFNATYSVSCTFPIYALQSSQSLVSTEKQHDDDSNRILNHMTTSTSQQEKVTRFNYVGGNEILSSSISSSSSEYCIHIIPLLRFEHFDSFSETKNLRNQMNFDILSSSSVGDSNHSHKNLICYRVDPNSNVQDSEPLDEFRFWGPGLLTRLNKNSSNFGQVNTSVYSFPQLYWQSSLETPSKPVSSFSPSSHTFPTVSKLRRCIKAQRSGVRLIGASHQR